MNNLIARRLASLLTSHNVYSTAYLNAVYCIDADVLLQISADLKVTTQSADVPAEISEIISEILFF